MVELRHARFRSVCQPNECHKDATCNFDPSLMYWKCECEAGMIGDGMKNCNMAPIRIKLFIFPVCLQKYFWQISRELTKSFYSSNLVSGKPILLPPTPATITTSNSAVFTLPVTQRPEAGTTAFEKNPSESPEDEEITEEASESSSSAEATEAAGHNEGYQHNSKKEDNIGSDNSNQEEEKDDKDEGSRDHSGASKGRSHSNGQEQQQHGRGRGNADLEARKGSGSGGGRNNNNHEEEASTYAEHDGDDDYSGVSKARSDINRQRQHDKER